MKKIMNFWINLNNAWRQKPLKSEIFNSLYLILFTFYLFENFLRSTMFEIHWPEKYHYYLTLFMIFFVIFKFVLSESIDLISTFLMMIVLLSFVVAWLHSGYQELIDLALLIVGACGFDYRKIIQTYLFIAVSLTIYTVISSQLGNVTNLIYDFHGRIRESFGFIYPTDFAAHIFFIVVAWVLFRQERCSYAELIVMVILVLFLAKYSDTRCSEITILSIVFFLIYVKQKTRIANKKGLLYSPSAFSKICYMLSPFVFAPVMILLCRFYNPKSKIMLTLNQLLTSRLKLGKKTFDNYDITLYGQYIEMNGNGGTTIRPKNYTFIDCSYISISMRFGLIVFIVVIFLIEYIMFKNINNIYILGLMMIICLHSMIEHHLFEYHYNIFMALPLACFENAKEHKKSLFRIMIYNIKIQFKKMAIVRSHKPKTKEKFSCEKEN